MSADKVVKLLDEVIAAVKELPGGVSLKEVKHCLSHATSAKIWAERYKAPAAKPEVASPAPAPEPKPVAEEVTEADDSEEEVVSVD